MKRMNNEHTLGVLFSYFIISSILSLIFHIIPHIPYYPSCSILSLMFNIIPHIPYHSSCYIKRLNLLQRYSSHPSNPSTSLSCELPERNSSLESWYGGKSWMTWKCLSRSSVAFPNMGSPQSHNFMPIYQPIFGICHLEKMAKNSCTFQVPPISPPLSRYGCEQCTKIKTYQNNYFSDLVGTKNSTQSGQNKNLKPLFNKIQYPSLIPKPPPQKKLIN